MSSRRPPRPSKAPGRWAAAAPWRWPRWTPPSRCRPPSPGSRRERRWVCEGARWREVGCGGLWELGIGSSVPESSHARSHDLGFIPGVARMLTGPVPRAKSFLHVVKTHILCQHRHWHPNHQLDTNLEPAPKLLSTVPGTPTHHLTGGPARWRPGGGTSPAPARARS